MPVLVRPENTCSAIFDPEVRGIQGIPTWQFVRPIVRQGGVFVDMPKGFELPTCMVDPCCAELPPG